MIGKIVVIFDCLEWSGGGIGKVLSKDDFGGGYYILDYADLNTPPDFQNCRFVRTNNVMEISFDRPQNLWYKIKTTYKLWKEKLGIKIRFMFNFEIKEKK